jgi:hypothetical protein
MVTAADRIMDFNRIRRLFPEHLSNSMMKLEELEVPWCASRSVLLIPSFSKPSYDS